MHLVTATVRNAKKYEKKDSDLVGAPIKKDKTEKKDKKEKKDKSKKRKKHGEDDPGTTPKTVKPKKSKTK